jgi:hypothetical protein
VTRRTEPRRAAARPLRERTLVRPVVALGLRQLGRAQYQRVERRLFQGLQRPDRARPGGVRGYRPAGPRVTRQAARYFEPGDPAYVAWFLWMVRQAYAAKRGAQGGEQATAKLFSAASSLHEIRTPLVQMRLWTLDQPFNLGAADPEVAALLARTYPHLTPAELLAATRALLAAYERVCPDYCRKTGTPYPADAVAALRRVLNEFDRLR